MTRSEEVLELVEQIKPVLAGKGSVTQSAVLAELLSLWLAGYIVPGDEAQTTVVRSELLDAHLDLVRQLTEVNSHALHQSREP